MAVGRMNVKRYWNKPGGIPENSVDLLRKFCRGTRHLTNVTRTAWLLAAFSLRYEPLSFATSIRAFDSRFPIA